MTSQVVHTDIAIIGGGIAGLWTLNQLRNRGYSAILFEHQALGSDQTIGSQGMIHGGVKYTLSAAMSAGSESIAAMPDAWRDCLAGNGAVDLRNCEVLSEAFYLWSGHGMQARMSAFLAGKALRGRVEKLAPPDYPAALCSDAFRGQVYRLADLVLDVPSLVSTLAEQHREAIFQVDWACASLSVAGGSAVLELPQCTVQPGRLLLTAGAGNESLLQDLGASAPAMQRRPLHQVLVRHEYQPALFGHCLGQGTTPRLTISSHRTSAGEPVWYLGGALAESGCTDEPQQLVERARRELAELLPWIDFGNTQWRTLRLDRAEPSQAGLLRPDGSFLDRVPGVNNALVAWPTKLTLCPNLGDTVEKHLQLDHIAPLHQPDLSLLEGLGRPAIATSYWEELFQ